MPSSRDARVKRAPLGPLWPQSSTHKPQAKNRTRSAHCSAGTLLLPFLRPNLDGFFPQKSSMSMRGRASRRDPRRGSGWFVGDKAPPNRIPPRRRGAAAHCSLGLRKEHRSGGTHSVAISSIRPVWTPWQKIKHINERESIPTQPRRGSGGLVGDKPPRTEYPQRRGCIFERIRSPFHLIRLLHGLGTARPSSLSFLPTLLAWRAPHAHSVRP